MVGMRVAAAVAVPRHAGPVALLGGGNPLSVLRHVSMVEQAHAGECHCYAVLVARLDDIVVANRAPGLRYVLHTALVGALNVVAEGEEGVAAQGHARVAGNPFGLLLAG